jgi:hypothetical protein
VLNHRTFCLGWRGKCTVGHGCTTSFMAGKLEDEVESFRDHSFFLARGEQPTSGSFHHGSRCSKMTTTTRFFKSDRLLVSTPLYYAHFTNLEQAVGFNENSPL